MIRLCWVFVVVAVVVPLSDARPHKCEQRERSIADLDLAEDALNRAKDLYPNCEEENESSNSTECSRKDKSLGFLDVALDLVTNAKKNIPICPKEPPVNVTTEEPATNVTTEQPLTNVTTEGPTTEQPFTNVTTEEPTPETTTEGSRPMDCQELQSTGVATSGVYTVWPRGGNSDVAVRCDMVTDGGGWTVIQRRGKFSTEEDFYREWKDYKHGFGHLEKEFWLGNDNIFALTNQGNYSLRMDMTAADGKSAYALFRGFRIENERSNYTLHLGEYSKGTAGSSMADHNGQMFTTKDRDNDEKPSGNCAVDRKGGFWYHSCVNCNPNGLNRPGLNSWNYIVYGSFKGDLGLSSFAMKIKRL